MKSRKYVNYANRGKAFERLIIETNNTYKKKGWAAVYKTEPPVKVQQQKFKKITLGFFERKGFVDFFGISHGRALAFDAKSTAQTTRFPLDQVSADQVRILKHWHDQGGVAFLLIEFSKRKEFFILGFKHLYKWWRGAQTGGRKSIPYAFFNMNCPRVKTARGVPIDYLKALEI